MTRRGPLKLPVAVAALALAPVLALAGPLPQLPTLPGPVGPPAPGGQAGAPAAPGSADQPPIFTGPEGRRLLGGMWTYRPDPRDRGDRAGWGRGWDGGRQVAVPYVPNAWPVTGRRGARNFRGSVGWYLRRFSVERAGRYAIRFESVHHRAIVWVDGRRVASHVGAYLPFEARVLLKPGREHTLVVRADWRGPLRMKRAGWHRGWFNFGGINRQVTIRAIGASEVLHPNVQTQLRGDGSAAVSVSAAVRNNGPARTVTLTGELRGDGQTVPFTFRQARIGAGATRVLRRRVVVRDPLLWSPSEPRLYELRLIAGPDAAWRGRVGLREILWRGGALTVNGRRTVLYGASLHEDVKGRGDAITPGDADAIVARLRRIGANATRALHPLSPVLLERLDAAGILVWQQVGPFDSPGNWMARTRAKRRSATARVLQSVAQAQTHPSILTWAVANEVAWNGQEGGQAGWIARTSRQLKRADPGRPVSIDVWGTHIPERAGPMYRGIDLMGVTSYIGWYEHPFGSRGAKRNLIRARVAHLRRVFPGKPVYITEFGAEANTLNPSGRHGGFRYQADLIALHLRAYEHLRDVDGMLIWNLSDFALTPEFGGGSVTSRVPGLRVVRGINQKGLFDYDGRAKPSALAAFQASAAVRARAGRLPRRPPS